MAEQDIREQMIDEAAFKMSLSTADDEAEAREYWKIRPQHEVKSHYQELARKALEVFLSLTISRERVCPECRGDGLNKERYLRGKCKTCKGIGSLVETKTLDQIRREWKDGV